MEFASKDARVLRIRAHTLPERNASTSVLTKAGFEKLGEVVDPDDGLLWRWERDPEKWGIADDARGETKGLPFVRYFSFATAALARTASFDFSWSSVNGFLGLS